MSKSLWSCETPLNSRRFVITPYLYVPLLAMVALWQATVAPHLIILGARPDLMLLTVVSWSVLRGVREGVVWGFVGGLCLDLFSGASFGLSALVLMAVGLFSGLGETAITRGRVVLPVVAALVATPVHGFLYLALLYIAGYKVSWFDTLLRVMLPTMIFNGLLIIPVYTLLRWLHRRTGREELEW